MELIANHILSGILIDNDNLNDKDDDDFFSWDYCLHIFIYAHSLSLMSLVHVLILRGQLSIAVGHKLN